jgi:ribose transport system permease protein
MTPDLKTAPAATQRVNPDRVAGEPEFPRARRDARWFIQTVVLHYIMVWIMVVLAIVSDILYPGFFAWGNIKNILSQNAPEGMVALGMTFVIIAGGFDLSVGALFAGGGVMYASWANHLPLAIAFLATCAAGMLAGGVNGLIVTKLKVNAFVATLGTASLFGGGVLLFANSQPIQATKNSFQTFGSNDLAGVPIVVWVLAAAAIVCAVLLARTVYGRSVYAIGGNSEAARLAGIRVDSIRASTYVLTGLCAGVAGMMLASRTGVGQPDVGTNVTLDSIAIVIIGGTSLLGGEGAIWRTVVGLLILGTINNLFDSLGWQTPAQEIVKGAIVIGAVSIDVLVRRRRV